MGIYAIKPLFRKALEPSLGLLAIFHPDVLSWASLAVSIIAALLLFYVKRVAFLWLAIGALLILRIALNALDGMVAQKKGIARWQGEVLNEMLDRYSDAILILAFVFSSLVKPELVFLAVISAQLSSFSGILGKAVGRKREYSGPMGKADRMIWLSIVCFIYFIFPDARNFSVSGYNLSLLDILMLAFLFGGQFNVYARLKKILAGNLNDAK